MLEKLTLTNFRRHESLSVDFTLGINAVRGVNEGGKSTLIESVGYALFGSKALRNSLDDCVTWGEPVNTLKVELSLSQGGEHFVFKRGKSGAEVLKNGQVFCTGQNEVSNFAATLLGADVATAGKLFLASQNGIRGALEEGPRALSQMIEDLAGFSTFDTILEAATQKLALGSPALLEERLNGANATLLAATETLPAKPDPLAHSVKLEDLELKISRNQDVIPDLERFAEEATEVHQGASTLFLKRVELERAVKAASEQAEAARLQVESLKAAASVVVDADQIPVLRQRIADADGWQQRHGAYQKFLKIPLGDRYSGTGVEFLAHKASQAARMDGVRDELVDTKEKITKLKFQRIDHDKCDKCGQDITHLSTVQETNARVDAALGELAPLLSVKQLEFDACVTAAADLTTIQGFAAKVSSVVTGIQQYVTLDESCYPAVIQWVGTSPGDTGPTAPRAELAAGEAAVKDLASAKAKLELAEQQHAKAVGRLEDAVGEFADTPGPDAATILQLTADRDAAIAAVQVARGTIILAEQEKAVLVRDYDYAKALWESGQARVGDATRIIATCRKDLDSLGYNNALVKKIRAIRPVIANRLWNTLLASVSVMFSQMRNEPSVVTKESAGFLVNGKSMESLSGSTLDILGIALRCALIRTFLPNCGLLVLDEPAQGCDGSRTEALLGFLQGIGMSQTLLITHEEISSSVSDNVIEL